MHHAGMDEDEVTCGGFATAEAFVGGEPLVDFGLVRECFFPSAPESDRGVSLDGSRSAAWCTWSPTCVDSTSVAAVADAMH